MKIMKYELWNININFYEISDTLNPGLCWGSFMKWLDIACSRPYSNLLSSILEVVSRDSFKYFLNMWRNFLFIACMLFKESS